MKSYPKRPLSKVILRRLPQRPIKNARVLMSGSTVIAFSETGGLYWNGPRRTLYNSVVGRPSVVQMLIRLGAVDKEDGEAYMRAYAEVKQQRDAARAADLLLDASERAGVKLTKYQRARLQAVADHRPRFPTPGESG